MSHHHTTAPITPEEMVEWAAHIIDPDAFDVPEAKLSKNKALRRGKAKRRAREILSPLFERRDALLNELVEADKEIKMMHTLAGNFHIELQTGIDRRAALLARYGRPVE